MCDEDARDAEHEYYTAMARGHIHEVTLDVTVRCKVWAMGSTHETDDVEDLVSIADVSEGDILNVEEV